MTTRLPLLFVLLLTAACGGDGPTEPARPPKPNVTGTWTGPLQDATLMLVLTHDTIQNAISGTGTLSAPGISVALSASGNYAGATASMTLSNPGYEPMNLSGTHTGDRIVGTVNGSGYQSAAITLNR